MRVPPPRAALSCADQAGATDFYAVWDGWLLDTLATWQKQVEKSYTISLDDERGTSPPPNLFTQQLAGITQFRHVADDTSEPPPPDTRHAVSCVERRGADTQDSREHSTPCENAARLCRCVKQNERRGETSTDRRETTTQLHTTT